MAYSVAPEMSVDHAQKKTLFERFVRRLGWANLPSAPHQITSPDFAAHNFGMVGFVKELVDEVAWSDVTFPGRGNSGLPRRPS